MSTLARLLRTRFLPAIALGLATVACSGIRSYTGDPKWDPNSRYKATEIVLAPETCRSSEPNVTVSIRAIRPTGKSFFGDNETLSHGDSVDVSLQDDRDGTLRAVIGHSNASTGLWLTIAIHKTDAGAVVTPELWQSNGTRGQEREKIENLCGTITLAKGRWTSYRDPLLFDVNISGRRADGATILARGQARVGTLLDQ